MHLLVIRHAIAEVHVADREDARRKLTREGARKFRKVARGLDALGWRFEHVLASPWKRAAQTAELLHARTVSPTELLCQTPGADLLAMIAEAGAGSTKQRNATALVGHSPWIGQLVALLAFGDSRNGVALAFKKGGVVWLEGLVAPGAMTIRAILPPSVLTAIA